MANTNPVNRPVIPKYGTGSGLRSPLDSDDLTNQHKKTAVVSGSNFGLANQVSRLVSQVNQLRRRIITPPTQPTPASIGSISPFEIYPQEQFVNPTKDLYNNLLTFQIRPGLVGVRPRYSNVTWNWYDPITQNDALTAGNFEMQLLCDATDNITSPFQIPPIGEDFTLLPPSQNQNGNINITYDAPTLIQSSIDGGITKGTQIILNIRSDLTYLQAAAFWIQVVNTDSDISVNMYGQLFDDTTTFPFPDPSNLPAGVTEVIPIGMIVPSVGYPALFAPTYLGLSTPLFFPINFYNQHIVNRYNPTNSSNFSTSPLNYRGDWIADNLTGQAFYPSDLVLDDTQTDSTNTSISGASITLSWNNYFICRKYQAQQNAVPIDDGINWQKFSQKNLTLSSP